MFLKYKQLLAWTETAKHVTSQNDDEFPSPKKSKKAKLI